MEFQEKSGQIINSLMRQWGNSVGAACLIGGSFLFRFMLSLVSGFLILCYNNTDANYHP